jgi:hypothetical protein
MRTVLLSDRADRRTSRPFAKHSRHALSGILAPKDCRIVPVGRALNGLTSSASGGAKHSASIGPSSRTGRPRLRSPIGPFRPLPKQRTTSAFGPKRTLQSRQLMSAFGGKADIRRTCIIAAGVNDLCRSPRPETALPCRTKFDALGMERLMTTPRIIAQPRKARLRRISDISGDA